MLSTICLFISWLTVAATISFMLDCTWNFGIIWFYTFVHIHTINLSSKNALYSPIYGKTCELVFLTVWVRKVTEMSQLSVLDSQSKAKISKYKQE